MLLSIRFAMVAQSPCRSHLIVALIRSFLVLLSSSIAIPLLVSPYRLWLLLLLNSHLILVLWELVLLVALFFVTFIR